MSTPGYDPRLSELAGWLRSVEKGAITQTQLAELYRTGAVLIEESPRLLGRPIGGTMARMVGMFLRAEADKLDSGVS